jgi:serine protease AprX
MPADRDTSAEVTAARARTRRLYGEQLAAKASDDFCLSVYRSSEGRSRTASVAFEAFGPEAAATSPLASVLEFSLSSVPAPGTSHTADRTSLVHATRTAGYEALSSVYDEIERQSAMSGLGPSVEVLGAPQIPTLVTQVCWLNRTVRTWAGPGVVADVCADHAVTAVDVPRRLAPDLNTPAQVAVGLPGFVAATKCTGKGVTIAVIDSEVALRHPALNGRVVHRRNYTAEPWGHPHAHGTAVAGIIAARDRTNGGMAPDATIYNYKVLATNRLLNGDDFGGALAIQQALEDGAVAANCSWGAGPVGAVKSREAVAVDTAWALGMTVVKSAGNAGPGAGTMTTPAEADGIIVVGATDLAGTAVQDYSSRGPGAGRPGPHCVAPGGDGQVNLAAALVGGGFGDAGAGTSYSAPHVTGAVALLLEQDPTLGPAQLRERIVTTAQKLRQVPVKAQGSGLLQLVVAPAKPPKKSARARTGR